MHSGAYHSVTVPTLHHCAFGWNRGKWMKLQFRQQWGPNQLLFRCLCYCPGILNTCLRLWAFFLCKMLPPDQLILSNDALMLSNHPYANQLSGKPGMYILAFKVKGSRDFTVVFWREQMVIISRTLGKYRQRIELLSVFLSSQSNQVIHRIWSSVSEYVLDAPKALQDFIMQQSPQSLPSTKWWQSRSYFVWLH